MQDVAATSDLSAEVARFLTAAWEWPDPFPLFERLQREDPIHFNEPLSLWVITDLALARTHLRDSRLSRTLAADKELALIAGHPDGARTETYLRATLLNLDGDRHRRIRRLVGHAFSARALDLWRPLIAETVEELMTRVAAEPSIEFLSEVAYPLPEKVICRMMGIPHEAHADFERWTYMINGLNYSGDPRADSAIAQRAITAGEEYGDYLRGLVRERRADLGDDLVSILIRAQEEDDHLDEDEIIGTIMSLVTAGHGTTAMLAGNALLALLEDRPQWEALCADPTKVPDAVEEFLRYDSPARSLPRVATDDMVIGGKTIKQGDRVLFPLPAANRDESLCPAAQHFDINRPPTKHIAFGFGAHVCLGAPLAREQAVQLFDGIVRTLPDIYLDCPREELEYVQVWQRGLRKLPLRRTTA
ncbi:MAG: Cytochrome [Pseudonocardiales bacterium]|nr:Cytochrome [Pseudonocardiales bacterium]